MKNVSTTHGTLLFVPNRDLMLEIVGGESGC